MKVDFLIWYGSVGDLNTIPSLLFSSSVSIPKAGKGIWFSKVLCGQQYSCGMRVVSETRCHLLLAVPSFSFLSTWIFGIVSGVWAAICWPCPETIHWIKDRRILGHGYTSWVVPTAPAVRGPEIHPPWTVSVTLAESLQPEEILTDTQFDIHLWKSG